MTHTHHLQSMCVSKHLKNFTISALILGKSLDSKLSIRSYLRPVCTIPLPVCILHTTLPYFLAPHYPSTHPVCTLYFHIPYLHIPLQHCLPAYYSFTPFYILYLHSTLSHLLWFYILSHYVHARFLPYLPKSTCWLFINSFTAEAWRAPLHKCSCMSLQCRHSNCDWLVCLVALYFLIHSSNWSFSMRVWNITISC